MSTYRIVKQGRYFFVQKNGIFGWSYAITDSTDGFPWPFDSGNEAESFLRAELTEEPLPLTEVKRFEL